MKRILKDSEPFSQGYSSASTKLRSNQDTVPRCSYTSHMVPREDNTRGKEAVRSIAMLAQGISL